MNLWMKFYKSGKISDYLNYKLAEKEATINDNN